MSCVLFLRCVLLDVWFLPLYFCVRSYLQRLFQDVLGAAQEGCGPCSPEAAEAADLWGHALRLRCDPSEIQVHDAGGEECARATTTRVCTRQCFIVRLDVFIFPPIKIKKTIAWARDYEALTQF
jgi:hypothetical protein